MNIQSGRNPVRRQVSAQTVQGGNPLSGKLKPILFIIFMIIAVAGVCEMHVYLKSGISSFGRDIERAKKEITHIKHESTNLRNKIEERSQLSYIKRQIARYNLGLKAPSPGQMHDAIMLSPETARVAAANMQKREIARVAALNVPQKAAVSVEQAAPAVAKNNKSRVSARSSVKSSARSYVRSSARSQPRRVSSGRRMHSGREYQFR